MFHNFLLVFACSTVNVVFVLSLSSNCEPFEELERILASLSKIQSPPEYPVKVNASLIIHNVRTVNTIDSTAVVFANLEYSWTDARLRRNCLQSSQTNKSSDAIPLDVDSASKIWLPRLDMVSAMKSDINVIEAITIDMNGRVNAELLLAVTIPCYTDVRTFPFDSLQCDVQFISQFDPEIVEMYWDNPEKPAIVVQEHVKLAEYTVEGTLMKTCSVPLCLGYNLVLKRYSGYYVLQAYVPSALIAAVAALSFLYGIDLIASRIALGLSALIAMLLQHSKVVADLPKVGYIKGIDVWMLGCIIFVLLAIGQSTAVAFYKRCFANNEKVAARLPNTVAWVDKLTVLVFFILCGTFIYIYFHFWT